MALRPLHDFIQRLCRLADAPAADGVTDGELLRRFAAQRDEAAFELLIWRHGAMVFHTCCRVLGPSADAEDAFQVTFLTLVRKAGAIRDGRTLPGWLHQVAHRAALRTQQAARRRARHERPGLSGVAAVVAEERAGRELGFILEQEVARLPEPMRVAFVLCHLEGRTAEEAAAQIGCPKGTVESRLARARQRLRARLTRRGLDLSTAPLPALALPASLVQATLRSAGQFAAGPTGGVIPAQIVSLTHGVLRAMSLSKLTRVAFLVVLPVAVALGGVLVYRGQAAGERAGPPRSGDRRQQAREEPAPKKKPIRLATRDKGLTHVDEVIASPDGKLIATSGTRPRGDIAEQVVLVWESATGKLVHELTSAAGIGVGMAFSPDSKTLAVPNAGAGRITLYPVDTWKARATLEKHRAVGVIAFTPDGKTLASLSSILQEEPTVSEVKLWDVVEGGERLSLKRSERELFTSMAFCHNGKTLAVGTSDGKVRLIEVATGKEGAPLIAVEDRKKLETRVAFAPDNRILATWVLPSDALDEVARVVRLWDPATGRARLTIELEKGRIRELAFSPDSKTLALASDSQGTTAITLYDTATGTRQSALKLTDAANSDVDGLAFSPDGKILAASGSEMTDRTQPFRPVTRFFSLADGRASATPAQTRSVTFTQRGGKVVLVVGDIRDDTRETAPDEVTVRDAADLVAARPR